MFNFSASHMIWLSTKDYGKAFVHSLQDLDTRRYYRVYDYRKGIQFEAGKIYCISGKVNSADKLYLILETAREVTQYSISKVQG